MACYSSNFENKLQTMVGIGKEYSFTLNFDMPRPFATRETKLRCKMANSQSDCRTPLVSQSRGRATNSLWERDCVGLPNQRRKLDADHPVIIFNNTPMKNVDEHKRLGIILDSNVTFSVQIKAVIFKTRNCIGYAEIPL